MILPSLKDSFVKERILADLNAYFLHYYTLLVYNFLKETYSRQNISQCESFFIFFTHVGNQEAQKVCNKTYSRIVKLPQLCFIECSKFPNFKGCDCKIFETDLLEKGKNQLLNAVKNFHTWVNVTTPHQRDLSLSCKYYKDECPPFIVVIQQLNTSMISLLGSQILEYVECDVQNPFTEVDKFDPAPIFREIPYMNVLNNYHSPWMYLETSDYWMQIQLIVKNDLVPPQPIRFARDIFFTSFDPFKNFNYTVLDKLYKADPFTIGNPCYNYSQVYDFQFFTLNATFTDTTASELSLINNRTRLQRDVYELDTDFQNCVISHTQPLFENKPQNVSGSLGYILPLKSRFNTTQFIYNNFLRRVLQYDQFPCPDAVERHPKYGVERRCYILNTNVLGDSHLGYNLDGFLNMTHAYQGAYYASLIGICAIEFGECTQAGIENGANIDCTKEKYDRDHQAGSNWISVDRQTGIVLYSELNYAMWGLGDQSFLLNPGGGCYLVPLFDVQQQIMYNYRKSEGKWENLARIKYTYQIVFYVTGGVALVLLGLLAFQLRVMIRARETKRYYQYLEKTA